MQRLVERSAQGALIRKAGAMAVVLDGGEISVGDEIRIVLPPEPRRPMERV
jgi:MOSC domain-containing protein YiiM